MTEDELASTFGAEYQPAPKDEWDDWSNSIEIKLSKQGQMIIGLGVGLGVVLLLNLAQGKVVVNLVKGHKMVVEAINLIGMNNLNNVARTSYADPSGHIDESKVEPVDEAELDEIKNRLTGYENEPKFGDDI